MLESTNSSPIAPHMFPQVYSLEKQGGLSSALNQENSTSLFQSLNPKSSFSHAFNYGNSQTNGFHNQIQNNQDNMHMTNNVGFPKYNNEDYFANSRSIVNQEKYEDNQNIFEQDGISAMWGQTFQQLNNNLHNLNQNSNSRVQQDNILKPVNNLQFNQGFANQQNNNASKINFNAILRERKIEMSKSNMMVKNENSLSRDYEQIHKKNTNEQFKVTRFSVKQNQGDEEDENEKSKNTRGLRYLSLQVKEIVCQKKQTTYKEVADTLVDNLKAQSTHIGLSEEEIMKDEQNIKRRVYDALNVLIASQVIQKKGKIVQSCPNSFLTGRCLEKANWDLVKQKQKELEEKKLIARQKRLLIHDYIEKTLAIKNLIERNKQIQNQYEQSQKSSSYLSGTKGTESENKQENDTVSTTVSQYERDHKEEIFKFPLTQISFQPDENSMVLKMNRNKRSLKIFSKSPVYIYGDLDVLTNFGFHKVDQDFMKKNIEIKLLKEYYSDEYCNKISKKVKYN